MNLAPLIAALIAVESGGDDYAVGDGGRSVGCLQISVGVIKDVNRVYGTTFTLNDRYNRAYSIQMCELYLKHYGWDGITYEQAARIWNGGPTGWKRKSTKRYWYKVRSVLGELHG